MSANTASWLRFTQEKLAERIDVNPVYMGQIKHAFRVPTVGVLPRITRALKVNLRDIISEL
jgi:transcriptional regulator with XRE-family HTH domain